MSTIKPKDLDRRTHSRRRPRAIIYVEAVRAQEEQRHKKNIVWTELLNHNRRYKGLI
jgi:hypothetical protein